MVWGGYRPGAGRPKGAKNRKGKTRSKRQARKPAPPDQKPETIPEKEADGSGENLTPLEYMVKTMNDPKVDPEIRARLAIAAAPFVHEKKLDKKTGKKDENADRAKAAGAGRFAPSAPPLKVVK